MRQINSYGVNMADDTRQVRIEERLKIKIGEAKNLPARSHGGGSHRDTYCVLSLDQEEIFRTSTMERTLNPFFGEEFQFEVPRRFRYLSIYAFDRDKHTKQDRVLGKVAIKREDLHLYNNKDHWFALRAVDADSEVQGKAHIEISCAPAPAAVAAIAELSRSESLRDRQQWTSRSKPPLHSMEAAAADADASPTAAADYWSDPERERHCATRADPDTLLVRVLECSELTTKNGQCDPFALVTVTYSSGRKLERRTKCRKKTVNPQFDECFCFRLQLDPDHKDKDSAWSGCGGGGGVAVEARVSVWHDAATPAFLGEVRLQLRNPPHAPARAWYFLTSRCAGEASRGATPPGTRLSAGGGACTLGSLRLLLQYTVDHVFPLPQYRRLNTVFLKSINVKPITASAVYILGEIVTNKTDAAQPLVRLFTHHDLIVPIVRQLADAEISALTDATTIFRGNTLVSKMMDEAMRLVGGGYLRAVLRPTLAAVLAERKPCEIDPARVKPSTPAHANLANLKDYVERVFGAITSSYAACPAPMCRLFDALRQCAARHFPRNHEVRYSVVSGFIFLRFFAPAILGPRLFDLTTEQIDPQTNRTLTLISKTIQSLGNLVSSRSAQQVCKEEYMAALYRTFCTPRHVQAIRQFLEIISTGADTYNNNLQDTPILLKEGTMIKRSEMARGGGGGSPRRRWTRGAAYAHAKRRHFRLTSGELSWSRGGGGKAPVRRLALAGVLAVAPVEHPPAGAPLGANNMFQIVHRERVLYVQANNCVERAEWMRLLSALCRRTPAAPAHAGYFSHGTWTCCGASGAEAEGCGEADSAPDAGAESEEARGAARLALRLDPARDLQRLHTLLINHTEQLDARTRRPLPEGCGAEAGEREAEAATLRELREAVFDLEHCHRVYRRSLARVTKVGSKQAPIGDDNYLQLAGSGSGAGSGAGVETGAFAWRTWRQEPAPPAPVRRDLASSSESLKRTEERSSGKSNRSTGSGYLKMSCLKHDLSEDSDASDKPVRPPKPYPLTATPPAPPVRPICEYVDMEPRAPERRSRGTTTPAPSAADDTTLRCKEYELMSNFSSCAAGAKDVPPAVPPRSHHLHALARRLAPEPEPTPLPDPLPSAETSQRFDYHLDDKLLEDLSADAYCELKVCEDEPEPAREPPPASPPRRAEREDCGIFSRFSVHRKSNPTKSQTSAHLTLKMSSSTSNVREVCAQPSRPFSERLTPFFLKKKSKPPEDDPLGELTPRFGQSRLYSRGQSLDLNVERERRGIERSATTASVPARHMNSSIVANLKFLSLHRYGAGGSAGAPSPPGAAGGDAPAGPLLVALSSADIRL